MVLGMMSSNRNGPSTDDEFRFEDATDVVSTEG
jgi:hypothetical protein